MILVLGLRADRSLPVLQYPRTENAVVTVTTTYYGADPDVVAGFITTPLENAIAQANGIDYMTSTSQSGVSTITVNLRLNYDADKALTEINTKVNSVLNQLPPGTQQPVLTRQDRPDLRRHVYRLQQRRAGAEPDHRLPGARRAAEAAGGRGRADRRDPRRARTSRCAPGSIRTSSRPTASPRPTSAPALAANNYISGLGTTKGQMVQVNLTASTSLHSARGVPQPRRQAGERRHRPAQGRRQRDARRRRLRIRRSASTARRRSISASRSRPPPTCSTSSRACTTVFPDIQAQLPQGSNGEIVYDFDRVREQLDPRGDPHAWSRRCSSSRSWCSCSSARCARCDPDRRHPAVAGRHLHDHAGASASRSIC